MSFQGDVAGLGLGELLQGLARGGREGVLSLRGGSLAARLGVLDGQLHLLPDEDEDAEVWRRRCQRAWVKDPDQRIDTLRMSEIAHAARMEMMFALLDCEGVHFRFEPGPLPDLSKPRAAPNAQQPLGIMETGAPLEVQPPVTCAPISVEYLLLEYARLTDEMSGCPGADELDPDGVPRRLCESPPHKSFERLWSECDGMSNVREVSDRLGWPIRQVRAQLQTLSAHGALRFADEREMLALAQRELQAGRMARTASRLAGWVHAAPAGAPAPGDAQMLLAEWEKGRLPAALAGMEARDARTLLARLDLAHPDPSAAIARWTEMRRHHKHDLMCELRALHWQHLSEREADAPAMTDLLRVARKFQDLGQPWRAGVVLRTAASRGPETVAIRLEIGQRMTGVGLLDEGAHWVVDACRATIEAGTPDRAIAPLRQLLAVAPHQREAKALLAIAHGRTVSGKRTRRNSVVALASALVFSIGAVVKVHRDQGFEERYEEVVASLGRPEAAQQLLQQHFGDDSSERVAALRSQIAQIIAAREQAEAAEWTQRFTDCQLECAGGDPVLGLKNALALPPAPDGLAGRADSPRMSSLLEGLAARLEQTLAEWGPPSGVETEAMHAEQRLAHLIEDLTAASAGVHETKELREFRARIASLGATLAARGELRAVEREKTLNAQSIAQQDLLLAAAQAHTAAGDLARAVEAYDRLAEVPGSEKLMRILAPEVAAVRAHHQAAIDARALAQAGRHAEALERLAAVCSNPREHLLPCRVDSHPQGARARFADETSRVTPFVLEVAPGERLALSLELDGFEPTRIVLEDPADRLVLLTRIPDATWHSGARVEALPVSVDEDYVVCDRAGRVARIGADGAALWSRQIDTLGGIARTPVFLPKRAGSLLAVTEDGAAWVVDANDGRLEGPWRLGNPPSVGPEPTASGVRVVLRDGSEALWSSRLKPDAESRLDADARVMPNRGHDAGLAVLRRSPNEAAELRSPWGDWTVAVGANEYVVRREGQPDVMFAARREGEWSYVAWEAPHARLPHGRLWVSDAAGLRAFRP